MNINELIDNLKDIQVRVFLDDILDFNPTTNTDELNNRLIRETLKKLFRTRDLVPTELSDSADTEKLLEERGKVYGDAELNHQSIGLAWTAVLQRFYEMDLKLIPPHVVALMMVTMKAIRAAKVFHQDNYDDLRGYTKIAEDCQKPKNELCQN